MLISETSCDSELKLNDVSIEFVNECLDFGITIHRTLRFTSHINNIAAKASIRANLILTCFVLRDVKTLMSVFKTYLWPLIEYASCVWSPTCGDSILQIESVQRNFTKRLSGFAHIDYDALNIDSL
jgi:hypothetical protein